MHILLHFLISIILVAPFGLSLFEILLVGFSGILIDVDHLFYVIFKEKIYSLKKFNIWCKKEHMHPHFYIFHFIEIILIFMIVAYYLNWYVFLVSIGFALHYLFDAVNYLFFYKSFKPWANYFSLILYLKCQKK